MKKSSSVIITALSIVSLFIISFSVIQVINAEKNERKIYSGYNRAFYELSENVEKIDYSLKKSALASDSYQLLTLASSIEEYAAFAISDLAQMDAAYPLDNINTFLNQAGDYIRTVALSHSDGSAPTNSEQNNFLMLSTFSSALKEELSKLREEVATGEITYSKALWEADETLGDHLYKIEKEKFSEFEAMSYDGHFSSHMSSLSSPILENLPEISKDDALKAAINYFSGNIAFVSSGETGGTIPAYIFTGDAENTHYNAGITKNGGKLLFYSESRTIGDSIVSIEEAIRHAKAFSASIGYPSLREVFYEISGGILTVTLAPEEKEVIYYPDLVKAEIALDTGSLVGFDAEDYLMNYKERTFPEISESAYDSIAHVNEDFLLKSLKKAVIPTEYAKELPCLEISGVFDDKTFLIYVNAETGRQEEILLLTENETGRLTH